MFTYVQQERTVLSEMLSIVSERDRVMEQLNEHKRTERLRQETEPNTLYLRVRALFSAVAV